MMTRLRQILIVSLLPLAGCGGAATSDDRTDVIPSPPPVAPAEASLKLYVFDCGHLMFDTVSRFSIDGDETDVRELIVPVLHR